MNAWGGQRTRSLKAAALWLSSLAILIAIIELISSYFLFYFQYSHPTENIWAPGERIYLAYETAPSPTFSILKTLINKATASPPEMTEDNEEIEGDPYKKLAKYDPELGWVPEQGAYHFFFNRNRAIESPYPLFHDWFATIYPDSSRATSREPINADRKIYVFGDSWTFGWALDDELTMAWQLQSEYKGKYSVRNKSAAGWGHTQSIINFRRIAPTLSKDDIIVFAYAQYLLPRNAPQPTVVASLATGLAHYAEGADRPLGLPMPVWRNGELDFDTIPLDCDLAHGYCDKKDLTLEELEVLTINLFNDVLTKTDAHIVVLRLDGPDDSVLKFLAENDVAIVDGRQQRTDMFTKDTMQPYDAHPGPISNHYWFRQLKKYIDSIPEER